LNSDLHCNAANSLYLQPWLFFYKIFGQYFSSYCKTTFNVKIAQKTHITYNSHFKKEFKNE
jgi:hypothetical protein